MSQANRSADGIPSPHGVLPVAKVPSLAEGAQALDSQERVQRRTISTLAPPVSRPSALAQAGHVYAQLTTYHSVSAAHDCAPVCGPADTLVDTLSVAEMLLYTAELKRPMSEPLASKRQAVEVLLDKLALGSCRWGEEGRQLRHACLQHD